MRAGRLILRVGGRVASCGNCRSLGFARDDKFVEGNTFTAVAGDRFGGDFPLIAHIAREEWGTRRPVETAGPSLGMTVSLRSAPLFMAGRRGGGAVRGGSRTSLSLLGGR